MEKHINVVAVLHIGFSLLGLIVALLVSTILNLVGDFADDHHAEMVLSIVANGISVFFIVMALPGIIGGIGLFKRKEWARILVLIISVLDLVNFPLGTAIGAYSIWALVQPEVVEKFGKRYPEENQVEQ